MPPIRSNPSSNADNATAHDESLAAIAPERTADAIRYAVLGIVAAGLRHSIAGQLQAIQGSAEVAATVLDRGGDRAIVARNLARIPNLCKSTGTRLGTLVEWLRPDVPVKGPARDCIKQCIELAGEDLALRGIEVAVDTGAGPDTDIDWSAMRELVVTDAFGLGRCRRPAGGHYRGTSSGRTVHRCFLARANRFAHSFAPAQSPSPTTLSWNDLRHLAALRGVSCMCEETAALLRFPTARV